MILGSVTGLIAYFSIGWFTASLIGATVSGIVFGVVTWVKPTRFDFQLLRAQKPEQRDLSQTNKLTDGVIH
jgi:hypothetical protein